MHAFLDWGDRYGHPSLTHKKDDTPGSAYYAGYICQDVANMLRYAHQMPVQFEESFLKGLTEGYTLPPDFRISIYLLNLLSLLDCLARCSYGPDSNQCSDIRSLINFFIKQLDNAL